MRLCKTACVIFSFTLFGGFVVDEGEGEGEGEVR
jgi:hypothetical protein